MIELNKIEITFEVRRIIFRNIKDGFTIASVYIKEHPPTIDIPTIDTVISGYFPVIHLKDEFKATGNWINSNKGYKFEVDRASLVLPETEKGMIDFLSKIVKGVGRKTAEKIVDEFKESAFSVIINTPKELHKIKGLNKEKIDNLHEKMLIYGDYEEVATFLIPLGVSHTQAVDIYEKFGYSSIEIIKKNPYILLNHTKLTFKDVDKIANGLQFSYDDANRIEYGLLALVKYFMNTKGDMFTYYGFILKNFDYFMKKFGVYKNEKNIDKEKIEKRIEYLSRMKKLKIDKDKYGNKCVYLQYYSHVEDSIVNILTNMNTMPLATRYRKADIEDFVGKYEKRTGIILAKKQKQAVFMAMENKVSVLTGGPGTGKTHTINTIIECLSTISKHSDIELAAPTGRAAKRITELTGRSAKTIHRLIGLATGEDEDELIPIEADFLIVDEASMIDAYVFYKLLSVVSEKTRILIVGDYNQLPSVGPGLILRDIINSKTVHTTMLNEIFRQAQDSQIVMNCHKMIEGVKAEEGGLTFDKNKKDFYFIEKYKAEEINDLIIRSIERLLATGVKFDDIQVLSVMNKGDLGVQEINKRIQDRFNPRKNDSDKGVDVGNNRYFRLNDRVMHTVNNYDLDVFNGEVGKIVSIENADRLSKLEVVVDFGDRDVLYNYESIMELILSYAITVHKSQGSEFKYVIMPFHQSLSILLNRNIIYTGWSRAKDRVVNIGSLSELNKGIDRVDNLSRNSNIMDRLIEGNKVIKEIA